MDVTDLFGAASEQYMKKTNCLAYRGRRKFAIQPSAKDWTGLLIHDFDRRMYQDIEWVTAATRPEATILDVSYEDPEAYIMHYANACGKEDLCSLNEVKATYPKLKDLSCDK